MFEVKLKNSTNKVISFIKLTGDYKYKINKNLIFPNSYFIIKINVEKNNPIICNLTFDIGILEIKNYLQIYDGISTFTLNSLYRYRLIEKIRSRISPLLPQYSYVKMLIY